MKARERPALAISGRLRGTLGVVGLASWVAGGVTTYVAQDGAGAVALIAAGAVAGILALVGRWPSRLSLSGNEIVWEEVRETVEGQIAAAQASDQPDSVVQELQLLRGRLDALHATGVAPAHPAELYDRNVEQAINRVLPGAKTIREQQRSRQVADYVVRHQNRELLVETKWRRDPTEPFRGRTLGQLANRLASADRLLVVVNATDVTQARSLLDQALPGRAGVARWRDASDDLELKQAIIDLLA